MGMFDWLFGSKDKLKKVPSGTKQQGQFHSQLLNQLMGGQTGQGYDQAQNYYQNLLNPNQSARDQFAEPYLQQFQEKILPMIEERYGGANAISSSGFAQSLGGAGAGLQSQLAQLFSSLQNEAAGAETNQFNQLGAYGLNYQPFQYAKKQGQTGLLGPLATAAGYAIGGPVGGAIGGGISSLFKKQPGAGAGPGGAPPLGGMPFQPLALPNFLGG